MCANGRKIGIAQDVTHRGAAVDGRPQRRQGPIQLARRFRELAGFTDDEVDDIAQMDHDALEERKAAIALAQEAAGAQPAAAG